MSSGQSVREAAPRKELALRHVCQALSAWTGIPPERLTPGRYAVEAVDALAELLPGRIFGQDVAIASAIGGIRRRFQLGDREGAHRPVWVALFCGSSGVGKTELARQIASELFGGVGQHLIRIDLSELREEHTIARLVGAPPGYKGHGEGGELTNALRRCRTGVLLLDEADKAHPAILTDVILPMIGEGVVHDMNDGRALDVSNMIVILTANLGAEAQPERPVGFGAPAAALNAAAKIRGRFPDEVAARIDDIVVFEQLSPDAARQVWQREAAVFENRLSTGTSRWRLAIAPDAEAVFLDQIRRATARDGARAVMRLFDRAVVDRCLALVTDQDDGGTIRIELDGDSIRYRVDSSSDSA